MASLTTASADDIPGILFDTGTETRLYSSTTAFYEYPPSSLGATPRLPASQYFSVQTDSSACCVFASPSPPPCNFVMWRECFANVIIRY